MIRELTCIGCPMGCQITVDIVDDGNMTITGNTCKRGEDYARKEVTSPTRIVTSAVRVTGGELPMVSVKTANDIPKDEIMNIMEVIRKTEVNAPVSIGDVIIHNILNTGVDIVATKNVK